MPFCVPLSPVFVLAVCHKVFCLAVSRARVLPVLFGVLQGQLFFFPCIAGLSLCLVHPAPSVCPCHPLILSWFSFYCTPRALHLFSCPLHTLPSLCTLELFSFQDLGCASAAPADLVVSLGAGGHGPAFPMGRGCRPGVGQERCLAGAADVDGLGGPRAAAARRGRPRSAREAGVGGCSGRGGRARAGVGRRSRR